MTEAELRAAICAEAMTWERTPYHGHARLKGVGVDCAQLPIAVYSAVGIIPAIQPEYSQQWMMHRDEEVYVAQILEFSREIDAATVQAGDLLVWKFGRTYSHSAIVLTPPLVIHAVMDANAVVQADYTGDELLRTHARRAFSVFTPSGALVYEGPK
jgi:cell wall-associated NlpC family hydrolase